MNRVKALNLRLSQWVFSRIFDNTIFTIFITVIVSSSFVLHVKKLYNNIYFLIIISIVLILYILFSRERIIKKVKLNEANLDKEWINSEIRGHIPSIARVTDGNALYIQFMDIPVLLNEKLPEKYALEFRSKVISDNFAWCINATIDGEDMHAYMYQYNPNEKKLRPHVLFKYDKSKNTTAWVIPDTKDCPLKSVNNVNLKKDRNGWYYIRTEVTCSEQAIKKTNYGHRYLQTIKPNYLDEQGNKIAFDRANTNKVIEVKIYDMNNFGTIIYHVFYNEPVFPIFTGGMIGFRNDQYESSLYKDVTLKDL